MKEKNFQETKQKQTCHNGPWNVKTQKTESWTRKKKS